MFIIYKIIKKIKDIIYLFLKKHIILLLIITIFIFIITLIKIYILNQYQNNNLSNSFHYWNNINKENESEIQKFANSNNNIYGILAYIELAEKYAKKNNFYFAEIQLKKALFQINDKNLKSLINLRLSRIQLQQNKINDALKTIDKITTEEYKIISKNTIGDAFFIKGNYKMAKFFYEKLLQSKELKSIAQIKLNNIPE